MISQKADKIMKKIKDHQKDPTKSITIKKVNFSWLSSPLGRRTKALIAYCADNGDLNLVVNGTYTKREYFDKFIYPTVKAHTKGMYKIVKSYYEKNGRSLTFKEYKDILCSRFTNMYGGSMQKASEHPTKSNNSGLRREYQDLITNGIKSDTVLLKK